MQSNDHQPDKNSDFNTAGNKTSTQNKSHGPQGVDKAPGEETPDDTVQFTQQSQKGKKVDADVTKEAERPIEQDDDL